jgi:putative transposase
MRELVFDVHDKAFTFPPEVCRVIYTTSAIESIIAKVRNIATDWGRPVRHWKGAMNQFAILYADRFTGRPS